MLRYPAALLRARRHLDWCITHWTQECPLGSGAVAGSSIAIDRTIQAHDLGFEAPSPNALDSTSTRDECLDLLALGSKIAMHLQSLATDVIAFAQTPFGWVKYPAAFGAGSSMMPNKRNPDAMELMRGECCGVAAAHGQALMLLKGLPSGYNRDLQCIKPLVRDAAEKLTSHTEMATAFLAELEFNEEALKQSLRRGDIDATLRMEQKVAEGMPLRDAHKAIAKELAQRTTEAQAEPAFSADAYRTIGSASPAETRRVAEGLLSTLQD
jgi:argininosuccinate lyase